MQNKWLHRLQDFLTVVRGTWFLLFLDFIALAAFLLISQGKDVLLVVMENTGDGLHKWQLLGLVIAVFFWSVSAEYGTRMLIYLTDNSGRSLDPIRVENRKKYQGYIANIALFFPVCLLIISFISVYAINHSAFLQAQNFFGLDQINRGGIIIMVLLVALLALLWWLYPGNRIVRLSKNPRFQWIAISPKENEWVTKLYGIFNDVRVDLSANTTEEGNDLPRDTELANGMRLPDSPYFKPQKNNPMVIGGANKIKVWMFHINIRFYKCLMRQLLILLVIAVLLIVFIGFIFPVRWNNNLGPAAIICFAFAAWQIVYVFLHVLDKAQPVPVRFVLLVMLVVSSIYNHDHPIRTQHVSKLPRQPLQAHFDGWVAQAQNDSLKPQYYRVGAADSIPVIFISAEGGALRTGAFTGMLLAHLQDKFPLFYNYVYCYSSVSGGTVGSNFFNTQVMHRRKFPTEQSPWVKPSRNFFKGDYLSAVTAKMVFSEVINYFLPVHIRSADRAIALEKSFELGWEQAYGDDELNLMSASFDNTFEKGLPAIFINTTEVESGFQNVWSNVSLNDLPFSEKRDLYKIQNTGLAYSSAINLSDRFPIVSPGGAFFRKVKGSKGQDSVYRRHYIDGGYYENKGSETLLQVLQALKFGNLHIKPYVLQFNFSGDTTLRSVDKFNEITEIIGGVYNTRSSHALIAQKALVDYTRKLNGVFIPINLSLNSSELPMNWVLSNTAIDRLDKTIEKLVDTTNDQSVREVFDPTETREIRKLFFYHKEFVRPKR